jgi:Reverse transcriptase (RNA-dependent DNA polymerase)
VSLCAGDSKAIWSKVNALLSPSAVASSSDNLSADLFATHFTSKVQAINTSMAHAQPPLITSRTTDTKLSTFRPVPDDEVRTMLSKSKAKHCDLDPISFWSFWLIKKLINQLTRVITPICNASTESCRLPTNQKCALVKSILKKPSLDALEPSSYCPISNLSFLSKLTERCLATRYVDHAERQHLFPARQSTYQKNQSMETTVVSVLKDVTSAADHGQVTALVLLDLSSAFDCLNHEIMIRELNERFEVEGQT